jgi:hypothetical protein
MQTHHTPRILTCALVCAAFLPSAAYAWRYVEPPTQRVANANGFATTTDGGLLISSADGVRRVDASGATTAFLSGPVGGLNAGAQLLPLPGGGMLVRDWQFDCGVSSLDGALRRRWSEYTLGCVSGVNAAGDIWLNDTSNLHRLDTAGLVKVKVPASSLGSQRIDAFGVAKEGGVVAASNATAAGGDTTIARFDAAGSRTWNRTVKNIAVHWIKPADDGTTLVGGISPDGPTAFGNGELYLASFDAAGAPRWSYQQPHENLWPLQTVAAGPDAAFVLAGRLQGVPFVLLQTPYRLLRVERGALAWHKPVCTTPNPTLAHLTPLPNGEALLVCRNGDIARFQRIDAAGTVRTDAALPLADVIQAGALGNDRYLLLGNEPGATPRTRMIVVNGSGAVVDSPFTQLQANVPMTVVNRAFGDDGATYLVTQARSGPNELPAAHHISKIDANGQRVWRRSFDVPLEARTQLSLGGGTLCLTGARKELRESGQTRIDHVIECLNAADGSVRWTAAPSDALGITENFSRVLADGTLIFLHTADTTHEFVRYDASGVVVARTRGEGMLHGASINALGQTTFNATSRTYEIAQYDAQGAVRFRTPVPAAYNGVQIVPHSTGADGSVIAFVNYSVYRHPERRALWSVGADGTSRWTREFESAPTERDIVRAGDALYFVADDGNALNPAPRRIRAISPQNGTTLWQIESRDPPAAFEFERPGRRVTANGETVLLATSWRQRLRVQRFDAATGFRTHEGFIACSDDCAQPNGVALDANGKARAALEVSDAVAGTTGAVISLPGGSRNTRIDQPGIAGAWWSPYANGEGIVIDYLPASRTFFAPWFTFSREGGNDPAGQRWYVVQGAVPANATSVELPITESSGGTFDAGPTVPARIVGKATFTFTDCNNATMYYTFDAATNGAATGSITLTRLVPSTENCILADGTTQTNPSTPSNGFNAQQSGSWFEPATSGQGLQFVVQPGGVFFAPWFTFDPAGPSDDPGRQRWFTIQGSLANATGGKVTAPIVQTIGGAFDRVPTNNMVVVGTATVTFNGCDSAKIDYRFDDTAAAGAMRSLAGSADLVKIGGCAQ